MREGLLDKMIEWEEGQMGDGSPEEVALFEQLIDSGVMVSLQGAYWRRANALAAAGLLTVSLPR